MKALDSPEAREYGWQIAPRSEVLPTWERRGRVEATQGDKSGSPISNSVFPIKTNGRFRLVDIADAVICCVPGEDRTNGFFVSCFVKGGAIGKKRPREPEPVAEPEAEVLTKRSKVIDTSEQPVVSKSVPNSNKKSAQKKKKKA
jgi:putative methyltransferase